MVSQYGSNEVRYGINFFTLVLIQDNSSLNEHKIRCELFNTLTELFPREMTQPAGNLLDLVPLEPREESPKLPAYPAS